MEGGLRGDVRLRWYYCFTPDYSWWDSQLREELGEHFDVRPVEIEPLVMHVGEGKHHFTGISKKLEVLQDCAFKSTGEWIVFSDCTLSIPPGKGAELASYMISMAAQDREIVFADNAIDSTANIGIIGMRCTKRVQLFWSKCLARIGENSWDQHVVNQQLKRERRKRMVALPGIDWGLFDPTRIVCGYEFAESNRSRCLVYKQFVYPSDAVSIWNQRMRALHACGFISDDTLNEQQR